METWFKKQLTFALEDCDTITEDEWAALEDAVTEAIIAVFGTQSVYPDSVELT